MKKLLVLMVVFVLTGAFAQGRVFGEAVSGQISVTPAFGMSLGLQAGMENLLGPLTLRGGATVAVGNAGGTAATLFGLTTDVLLPFTLQGPNLYAGLGGGLVVAAAGGASATAFQVRGILGLEFPVAGKFSLLTEVVPGFTFAGGNSAFGLGINLGPRLYF